MYKLFNFPSVNVITIPECKDRISYLLNSFNKYNVKNITVNEFKKYEDGDFIFEGEYCKFLEKGHRGIVTSHLKAIKNWYNTTTEDYTIFCEDDLNLESVDYWKFEWSTFFNALPKNWGCVQLVVLKDFYFFDYHFDFRKRNWDDWSACCYLMKRSFAKKIIDFYYPNEIFTLDYRGIDEHKRKINSNKFWLVPCSENLVYSLVEPVYTVPLFLENIKFKSTTTMYENQRGIDGQGLGHIESYNSVLTWWKTKGLDLNTVKNCSDVFG